MPRLMSTAMLNAINATLLQPAIFFAGQFVTGPVYLWTGIGTISWNGQNWTGIGDLGSVSTISEGNTVEARGITVSLSGFDSALLTEVLNEFQLGLPVTVYLGMFNGNSLIADPIVSFSGRMDQPTIDVDAGVAVISINCESRLIDMNTSVERRLTQDDLNRDYPGDLGLQFVAEIQEQALYWGTSPTSSANI